MQVNHKLFTLIFVLFLTFSLQIYAQTGELTGSVICGDGVQKTDIGITGIDPHVYYVLYHNGEMVQMRKSAGAGSDKSMTFGTFKDGGEYTAVGFTRVVDGFPPKMGKAVKGKIRISTVPVLMIGDTLRIKSGEALSYQPKADLSDATFSWSATLKSGKVAGFVKKGDQTIHDVIRLQDNSPACLVYSITPYSAQHSGSCMGTTRELFVIIKP